MVQPLVPPCAAPCQLKLKSADQTAQDGAPVNDRSQQPPERPEAQNDQHDGNEWNGD